jgi:hypothetical protein
MPVCEDENDSLVIGIDEVPVCGIEEELTSVIGDDPTVVEGFAVELPMVWLVNVTDEVCVATVVLP